MGDFLFYLFLLALLALIVVAGVWLVRSYLNGVSPVASISARGSLRWVRRRSAASIIAPSR